MYERYMQMYYEAERMGYSFRDYIKERDLLIPENKLAFFAVDEFGVMIYRVCQRLGIEFSVLVSDIDREITYQTHENLTESLKLQSIDKVNRSDYTNVFMATAWNKEQVDYVSSFCPNFFLFDAAVLAMYTRVFLLNKIALIKERNPEVKIGLFFTPFISQIPGEHSELENFFCQQGPKMQNILHNIQDDLLREKAKESCYKKHGFNDEYIESVLNANFHIVSYNGVYMLENYTSKYVNVVNHRRVTMNNPKDFTNTVFFFGDSCVTGFHVGDNETIESYFQNILNKHDLSYQVQNCSNTWGGHFDWIFTLTDTMQFKPGDILLFCSRVDWMTEQYIKYNNKKLLNNILGIHTTSVLMRPHDFGEIFVDDHHCNGKGNSLIAQKIFDDLKAANFFDKDKKPDDLLNEESQSNALEEKAENNQLAEYLNGIRQYKPRIGGIVMNCNPFTLGHRYLIEYAARQTDKLYIFVVEEDKSVFPFEDRFELVKKGIADLSNVIVIPSGKFIISSLTFKQYFEKGENQDVVIDASNDVEIFAKSIAPALNITVRFAGEEPLDNVTKQYNASMRSILPQYGIEFAEIPRKKQGDEVISASRVRKLLETKEFDSIAKLVPKTTLDYLLKKY